MDYEADLQFVGKANAGNPNGDDLLWKDKW